jgi:hypothetical protein
MSEHNRIGWLVKGCGNSLAFVVALLTVLILFFN